MSTVYEFSANNIQGEAVSLNDYQGQVLLIANVASKCGFTPQYEGLEKLYEDYADQGFAVLGFPCNQFGSQEPGSEEQIVEFCTMNFGVKFPMFAKIDVNGDAAHPLYQHLKTAAPGVLGSKKIKWNFTKFLVGKDGQVVKRYAPTTKPADIAADIEAELAK